MRLVEAGLRASAVCNACGLLGEVIGCGHQRLSSDHRLLHGSWLTQLARLFQILESSVRYHVFNFEPSLGLAYCYLQAWIHSS